MVIPFSVVVLWNNVTTGTSDVDLLDMKQLLNNDNLLKEVLKEGIRIYG